MKIERIGETSSTNDEIRKYLGGGENVFLIARRQTAGRGTKGRTFLSGEGGVYASALLFPPALPAAEAFRVMAHAAVAVCRTAERFGVSPEIKWANDVLVGGRKLAGILIENTLAGAFVRSSIVGIGLNVQNDVSPLGNTAVTLSAAAGRQICAEEAARVLIEQFCRESSFEEYLSYAAFLGKEIVVTEGGRTYRAIARGILPDGRLEIEAEGGRRALSAAEISIARGIV